MVAVGVGWGWGTSAVESDTTMALVSDTVMAVEVESDAVMAVEVVMESYPKAVAVMSLPIQVVGVGGVIPMGGTDSRLCPDRGCTSVVLYPMSGVSCDMVWDCDQNPESSVCDSCSIGVLDEDTGMLGDCRVSRGPATVGSSG